MAKRPTSDMPTWMKWVQQRLDALDARVRSVGQRPGAVLIESTDTTVPDGTPVGTVVFKKGTGVVGWWDGSTITSF